MHLIRYMMVLITTCTLNSSDLYRQDNVRSNSPAQFKITINGDPVEIQKPEYVNLYDRTKNLKDDQQVYAFTVPVSCLKMGDNVLSFNSENSDNVIIERLEIALKYGDVKTHGYF